MKTAPDPKDVQAFQFKQSSIQQLSDSFKSVPAVCSAVSADGKRGLIYVGCNNKIIVLKFNSQSNVEWKIEHLLEATVTRIALSCDNSYLAVTFLQPAALIYDASSLTKNNLELLYKVRLSSSNEDSFAVDFRWNPCIPGMFCTVTSDNTIGSFQVKNDKKPTIGLSALEKLEGLEVLCTAWSPKGKQLVVGCRNGNIVQLKPDLKIVRIIVGPTPNIGGIIAILWISNYQFCAAYWDPNESRINVLIIDAPKGEANAIFTCYDDITYGMPQSEGVDSRPRYYFDYVAEWGLIIAASSGSSEIAVLGSNNGGVIWEQWQQIDSGRAQLPLVRTDESYPIGLAVDRSSTTKLPWGADSTLPHPVPILHIFGTSGQLCSFHMVNLSPNCPAICSPPTETISVSEQLPTNIVHPEISFDLNNGATSTPRPKQVDTSVERPKVIPAVNLFGNSPKSTGFLSQPEVKLAKPRAEKGEVMIKPEVKSLPNIEANVQEKSEIDDSICVRAFQEEQNHFEKELKSKLEPLVWDSGTEIERKLLGEKSALIDQFLRELRETTNSLANDIAYLKALLLQSFAWLEETKSKNSVNAYDNARSHSDANKVMDIQRLLFYTQSQLIQATKVLDLDWTEHKCQEKSKMKIPSLEFVYQSLLRQSQIIAKEKAILQEHMKKWKSLTRGNQTVGLNRSMANLHLSSSFSATDVAGTGGAIELRCRAIASRTCSFSREKQNKLRNLLTESPPRIIKSVNSSPVQNRLEATLSSLATLSPSAAESKSKSERTLTITPAKSDEKVTAQSPLASLNTIVSRIGSLNSSGTTTQSKTQSKPISISSTLPSAFGTRISQTENKQCISSPSSVPQSKVKQTISIPFGQTAPSAQVLSNFPKSFSNIDSIGTLAQKVQNQQTSQLVPKESLPANGLKPVPINDLPKIESITFNSSTLKNVMPVESFPVTVTQSSTVHTTTTTTTTTETTPSKTAFSFATLQKLPTFPSNLSTSPKTISTTPTTPSQKTDTTISPLVPQTFSFASKPVNPTTFSFGLKTSAPTAQGFPQGSLDLTGLSLGLQNPTFSDNVSTSDSKATSNTIFSFASAPNFSKPSTGTSPGSVFNVVPTSSPSASVFDAASTTPTSGIVFTKTPTSSPTAPVFGKVTTNSPNVSTTFSGAAVTSTTTPTFGAASPTLNAPVFGGITTSTPTTSAFEVAPTSSSALTFGIVHSPSTVSTFGAVPTSSVTTSAFEIPTGSLTKPAFGEASTNSAGVPVFGGTLISSSATPGFTGTTTELKVPVFGKSAVGSSATSVFGTTPVSSTTSIFGKAATSPSSTLSGGPSSSGSIFGAVPTTSTPPIFGGAPASTGTPSIFGEKASPSTSSIFGGNSSAVSAFGGSPAGSIFDGNSAKPSTTSIFGGTTASGSPSSVFGTSTDNSSTIGAASTTQASFSAFGQSPSFNTKPVFGSSAPVFGASKPVFGSTFGSNSFGAGATATGFGNLPAMGGMSPPMGDNSAQKVFGGSSGSSTFESLAGQSGGLTFGSLAQTTVEPEKPPQFSGGSSFQSWR